MIRPWPAALCVLLVIPTAAAVPYLQFGVDAARTGVTTDPGPEHFDLAFTAVLPGRPAYLSVPLIIGEAVFVLVEGEGVHGLYRVDLATTEVTRLVAYDRAPSSLASDGERLFVAGPEGIEAYGLDGAGPLWYWMFPDLLPVGAATRCAPLAVDRGDVFAACTQGIAEVADRTPELFAGARIIVDLADAAPKAFVVRLDSATGQQAWLWDWEHGACTPFAGECIPDEQALQEYAHPVLTSLAVTETRVVSAGTLHSLLEPRHDLAQGGEATEAAKANAIDRETGSFVWGIGLGNGGWDALAIDSSASANVPGPVVAATADTLYALTWRLHAVSVEDGTLAWRGAVSPRQLDRPTETNMLPWHGSGLALAHSRIFAGGAEEVVAFDDGPAGPATAWRSSGGLGLLDQNYGFIVWGDRLVGASHSGVAFVLSAASGVVHFTEDFGPNGGLRSALGQGVAVMAAQDGRVAVLGRTAASVQPALAVSAHYPDIGETLRVDLAGTGPGVLGPAAEYRVEWGDGRIDTWQAAATFEHAYTAPGDHYLRAFARNDAGQVASQSFTVHVGGSPPRDLNFMQQAFAPGNQDMTFGLLGIALALGGGMLAVARVRRRRRRVARELAAIEAAYDATKERPRDCEAALAERRAHVQGLGLDGRLDQPEVLLLERRIDELARGHRLGMLESRFQFLPYGFVMSLREMLADGAISVWEREHILRAIDADRSMTAAQKKKVRGLVEEWADQDEGVAA